jgi:hypothetical protein
MQRLQGEPEPGDDVGHTTPRVAVEQCTTIVPRANGKAVVPIGVCWARPGELLAAAAVPIQPCEHERYRFTRHRHVRSHSRRRIR